MRNINKKWILFAATVVLAMCVVPLKSFAASLPTVVWNKTYSGGQPFDNLNAVAVDSSGNVYVVDSPFSSGSSHTIKYDSSGTIVWDKALNSGGSGDNLNAVAVDSSGNVYVAGDSYIGSIIETRTIKYDSSGGMVWNQTFSSGGFSDELGAVTVDSSGNVYVAGQTETSLKQNIDRTIKYDSSGGMVWNQTFSGGSGDTLDGVAVDSSGNVYVTGSGYVGSVTEGRTIKYDSSGGMVWNQTFSSGFRSTDALYGVAVDSSGNVYVVGGGTSGGEIIKYDSSGGMVWNQTFWNGGLSYDINAVTVDSSGNIYTAGSIFNGLAGRMFGAVIKYDSSGAVFWNVTYDNFRFSTLSGIAVNSSGNIYVTGSFKATINYSIVSLVTPTCVPNSIGASQKSNCTAVVSGIGIPRQDVTWSLPSGSIGSIDSISGIYTAPASLSGPTTVTVIATSNQDPTVSGSTTITLGAPSKGPISVAVSCNPTSILLTQTSNCSAPVTGTSNQSVIWSTNDGTITLGGLFTPTAAGSATITATSVQDPSKNGSVMVTVNAPPGTITVSSENSVLPGLPVNSSWSFVGPTDPCSVASCNDITNATYNSLPFGTYIFNPLTSTLSSLYTLNSIRSVPTPVHSSKSLSEQLLSFSKNMLLPTAEAWTYPSSTNPLVQSITSSNSTISFVVLWNPSAALSISPSSVSSTATAGGAPVNTTVNITNTGAPGSTLTWTATVNASSSSWLSVSPAADATGLTNGSSGNAAENITVSADPGTLSVGTYPGTITLDGFTKNPDGTLTRIPQQTLAVTFTVNPAGGSSAGFSCVSNACVAVPSGATYPNPGGATSCAAACIPPSCGGSPCGAPVCTLSATPSSVIIPQQATLSYNCTNIPPASSCKITGGNIASPITLFGNASNVVNGTTKVSPTSNSVYTIACSAPGGNTSASVPVNIGNSNLCESNPGGVNCPGK